MMIHDHQGHDSATHQNTALHNTPQPALAQRYAARQRTTLNIE